MLSARLYYCLLCRQKVEICTYCDRGNIYCNKNCSILARQKNLRHSSQRYQKTYQGRLNHAKRQATYLSRKNSQNQPSKNKVTHHGSPAAANNVLLQSVENKTKVDEFAQAEGVIKCDFCHKEVSDFFRRDFLKGRKTSKSHIIDSDFKPP
jgi:hypothetical protein